MRVPSVAPTAPGKRTSREGEAVERSGRRPLPAGSLSMRQRERVNRSLSRNLSRSLLFDSVIPGSRETLDRLDPACRMRERERLRERERFGLSGLEREYGKLGAPARCCNRGAARLVCLFSVSHHSPKCPFLSSSNRILCVGMKLKAGG